MDILRASSSNKACGRITFSTHSSHGITYLLARRDQEAFSDFPVGVCGCPTQRPWCPFGLGLLIAVFAVCPLPRDDRHAQRATASTRPCSHPRTPSSETPVAGLPRPVSHFLLHDSASFTSSSPMVPPKPRQRIMHTSATRLVRHVVGMTM